jgi:hypothetical protein
MIYQEEFYRMKRIYDQMPPMKRDLIGPILALPLVSMALFFLALLPFGLATLAYVLLAGVIGAAIATFMIVKMVDIRKEIAQWRAAPATAARPGDIAIQMLTIANDPGQVAAAAAEEASCRG